MIGEMDLLIELIGKLQLFIKNLENEYFSQNSIYKLHFFWFSNEKLKDFKGKQLLSMNFCFIYYLIFHQKKVLMEIFL